ncbi:site-specific integrase [Dyadobacter pollutisoli]|uniref:Site-specific integrase n=1 Tax=Dyadobacter pollutisoli TaxID=2910158 RepID=A0A9E8SKF8_9BACT|nr:site-specific integrase [Dyadobacter pollutisoli]WAC12420.1 site-specific integrase [Dyadobacter pollutisoli]
MKPTNFSKCLTGFLTGYLAHERGASKNTINAYRDTFILFISYMEVQGIPVSRLTLENINQMAVIGFLDWLQVERKNGNATRNARLAAIHAFFHYMQYQHPEHLYECQKILSIPMKRKATVPMNYLTIDAIKILLQQPDTRTVRGRRDLALLSLMYDTGARVQEIIDLTPSSLRLDKLSTIRIKGKGNKTRIVPMLEEQARLLKPYLKEHDLVQAHNNAHPLFFNSRAEKLTRAGVNHILLKYADMARKTTDQAHLPEKISCHTLRHSKAMHLLQAGVNLVYIRDILGHVSVQTTEVYARADSRAKREAIQRAYTSVVPEKQPVWLSNENLLDWLKRF